MNPESTAELDETAHPAGTINKDGEYALTLRQYEQRERERCIADYGTAPAEYDRLYPRGSRRQQWYAEVAEAARKGVEPSRYVLRALLREFGERTIYHIRLDVEQARSHRAAAERG